MERASIKSIILARDLGSVAAVTSSRELTEQRKLVSGRSRYVGPIILSFTITCRLSVGIPVCAQRA